MASNVLSINPIPSPICKYLDSSKTKDVGRKGFARVYFFLLQIVNSNVRLHILTTTFDNCICFGINE